MYQIPVQIHLLILSTLIRYHPSNRFCHDEYTFYYSYSGIYYSVHIRCAYMASIWRWRLFVGLLHLHKLHNNNCIILYYAFSIACNENSLWCVWHSYSFLETIVFCKYSMVCICAFYFFSFSGLTWLFCLLTNSCPQWCLLILSAIKTNCEVA